MKMIRSTTSNVNNGNPMISNKIPMTNNVIDPHTKDIANSENTTYLITFLVLSSSALKVYRFKAFWTFRAKN